jgi:hypothetical protein
VVLKEAVVMPFDVLTPMGLPTLPPSIWNWTVPVGMPAPGAVTLMVAVKVTLWSDTDGLIEDVTTAFVLALVTVWPPGNVPLLLAKVLSPL